MLTMKHLLLSSVWLLASLSSPPAANQLAVASFSTILTEIAQKVGGDLAIVFGLGGPTASIHTEPDQRPPICKR